jgi:putative ABC transport system ATP-binding protein
MNRPEPLLSLKNIIKKYRIGAIESTVLKGVSVAINQGELLAILGASGSGKSTLMNILGLLDKPDAGQYVLQGQDVAGLRDDQLALLRNQYIGFVFQQFNLLPRFTAEQNIALPLIYRNESAAMIKKKVKDVLARVGMQSFGDHRPTQLSGGQQQRIAIARALVTEPQVILADEPTGALDSATGKDIMQLFLALNQEGRTLILVTHDESVALQCARRIHLADGDIVAESRS